MSECAAHANAVQRVLLRGGVVRCLSSCVCVSLDTTLSSATGVLCLVCVSEPCIIWHV